MSEDLRSLTLQLRAFAQARQWQAFHAPKNLAIALSVESAELLEHFQWVGEEASRNLSPAQRDEVALEIADVLMYLLMLADQLSIDPLDAAQRKLAVNEQRYPVDKASGRSDKYDKL